MTTASLTQFVRSLSVAEYSEPGQALNLSVKYRGDAVEYMGWALPRGDYITDTGLRDPGFGSGPVRFVDIEYVLVHPAARGAATSEAYRRKFQLLLSEVRGLPEVTETNGNIVFSNGS